MGTWPSGAQSAFAMTFDFDAEEVWIGEDPDNARRPGVLSQGTYGPRVAIPLLLDILARHGITATFFVPGKDAERHPNAVRAILDAGHEVGHHGYTHTSVLNMDEKQEREELERGLEVLTGLGASVTGYRSPSWDLSPHTLDLLQEHGFAYSSNLMDDIRPYRHANGIVELPVHWILDDAAHFWFDGATWTKTIRNNDEVMRLWVDEATGIHALGGLTNLTTHPMLIGRPGRLALLDSFLSWVREHPDVWIATAHDIAAQSIDDRSRD